MSLLDTTDNLIEKNDTNEKFVVPKVFYDDKDEISLKKAFLISFIIHPLSVGAVSLMMFVLTLLGLVNPLAHRPDLKPKDIEFVLVEHEAPPINKKTPYRADRNSRAGGKHNPAKKVSMPSRPAGKLSQKQTPAKGKQGPKATANKPVKQQPAQTVATAQPAQQPAAAPSKQPPSAKPSLRPPLTPKTTDKPTSKFTVPVPTGGTQAGKYSTGPVAGSGKGSAQAVTAAKNSGPAPTLAPTGGGGSANGSKLASGGGGGYGGSMGNPGPGNPNGAPGIDAIKEPDFGPYMRELQRRIKMNWDPPKGDESKRVVLLFKIAKDGRLLSCSVHKSSGLPNADKAAIQAVQLTAPFKPLPPEFKGANIDIQFTFDYNVFGAKQMLR